MYTSYTSSRRLLPRAAPADSLIATIVVLSVASTLFLASLIYLSVKIWQKLTARPISSTSAEANKAQAAVSSGRKQSDWARQNSNVLWSMYIEEDDLKAQFALPRKSRLFSIGSVSTIDHGRCPLDRRQSQGNALSQHQNIGEKKVASTDNEFTEVDLRNRNPYEQQTTPTKTIQTRTRAMSQPSKHRSSDSFEEMARGRVPQR